MKTPHANQIEIFRVADGRLPTQPKKPWQSFSLVAMAGDLIGLFDFLCVLLIAPLAVSIYAGWPSPPVFSFDLGEAAAQAGLVVALLAPFVLYERQFGALASRGPGSVLVRSHLLRFLAFAVSIVLLGAASQSLVRFRADWVLVWFTAVLASTSATRWMVSRSVRGLLHQGVLTEVVAVVGAGAVADRLVHQLQQARPQRIELLGVFDDNTSGTRTGSNPLAGTITQLIELGKNRRIDWIVLTLPPTSQKRLQGLVQRLKALSVPIALCPQNVGLATSYRPISYVGDGMPVSLLSDRPLGRWDALIQGGDQLLPRWIVTLAMLPVVAVEALSHKVAAWLPVLPRQPAAPLTLAFDDHDLSSFTATAAGFGQARFAYAVTPNADHVIRLSEDAAFRALYASADFILLDSRFLAHVMRLSKGLQLPVCTGSDLTEKLLSEVISADDPVVLIGGTAQQARQLAQRYGLRGLAHFNPPMGFIRDPVAVQECLAFVEAHSPFRFCLLAVGAPQQEALAQQLKTRGVARGLALCIGASINFLTGEERRAPLWMQRSGMEWAYRLMQAPTRMASRYLVRGPRVFSLLLKARIVLRKTAAPIPAPRPSPIPERAPRRVPQSVVSRG
jgi:exopolysaccharide biosynthesis WecB/TagA/CpsF family protein